MFYVVSLFLLLGNRKLVTCLLNEFAGEPLRITRALDAFTDTILIALKHAIVVSGLHHHVVILHNQMEGQLLPTGYHLVALLTTVISEESYSGVTFKGQCLYLNLRLKTVVGLIQGVAHSLQGGEHH